MEKKPLNTTKKSHKLDKLFEGIAEAVSSNPEAAKEFLDEEDVDADPLIQENIQLIKRLQAKARLEQGKKNQNWFIAKKEAFLKIFESNPDNVKAELAARNLQVNFRNFDMEGLSDTELNKLFEDASFLDFIENQSPDDDKTES